MHFKFIFQFLILSFVLFLELPWFCLLFNHIHMAEYHQSKLNDVFGWSRISHRSKHCLVLRRLINQGMASPFNQIYRTLWWHRYLINRPIGNEPNFIPSIITRQVLCFFGLSIQRNRGVEYCLKRINPSYMVSSGR